MSTKTTKIKRYRARTAIHLVSGEIIKVEDPISVALPKFAQMQNTARGSAFEWREVTDHGTLKSVFVRPEVITHISEL